MIDTRPCKRSGCNAPDGPCARGDIGYLRCRTYQCADDILEQTAAQDRVLEHLDGMAGMAAVDNGRQLRVVQAAAYAEAAKILRDAGFGGDA